MIQELIESAQIKRKIIRDVIIQTKDDAEIKRLECIVRFINAHIDDLKSISEQIEAYKRNVLRSNDDIYPSWIALEVMDKLLNGVVPNQIISDTEQRKPNTDNGYQTLNAIF